MNHDIEVRFAFFDIIAITPVIHISFVFLQKKTFL